MHHRIEYHHKTGARVLSLLLCILFLFSVDPAVSGALVVPVQAASAGVAAAATRGVSGLQTLASDLSVRFGGMFSGFSAWLLSITPDPDVDPDADPDAPHNLPEVYWNVNPNDQVDANTNDVLLYGGNDENDGATAETPVLTWERAMQLVAAGGKIWEMNTDTANVTGERSGEVEGQAVTVDFYGKNPLLYLTGTPMGADTVTDLTLSYLNMFDLTEAEDPSNDKRLVTMQGGTLTLDAGMAMRGDVLIEKFADETANAPSPEIYVTEEFADDFAANMNITLRFYCNEHTCHTNSGDKTAFDFIVFPEGFDASVALNSIHLHDSLTTNFGDDLLIWKVRVKPDEGCGNIIQVYLAEPYDGAVYLSGIGDDLNDGLYPDTPVKTYERAVQILTGTAPDSAEINAYRQEHGDYEPNEGIIRICGAPVHIYMHVDANDQPIEHSETWSMPADTYWYDNSGNVVSPSWVERYKNYQGDMILVEPFVQFTLTDITVKGNRALQPNAEGSILVVSSLGSATIGENALLTENHARVGGGVRMEGFLPTVTLNGGNIVNCYANRYVDAGTEVYGAGGGVYAFTGVFNMLKGEIRGCRAIYGGGVFIDHAVLGDTNVPIACDFRLKGNGADPCQIVNCSAEYGGGVYTRQQFTLLSTDTTDTDFEAVSGCVCRIPVTGCTAVYYGAGWAAESTTFTIDGGEVTGNSITINETNGVGGAGVYALNSYFRMINGGSVHGNNIRTNSVKGTPAAVGGGVYCQNVPLPLMDENDPAVVLQYPVEIGEGCEIFDNHIYSGNKTVNMRGAGLAIAGAALRVCVIDGLIHDNTFNLLNNGSQQSGTGWGAGIFCTNSPMQIAEHCRVYNNGMEGQSTVYGCGVYHNGGVLWLDGCEIDHNFHTPTSFNTSYSCYTYGGGIYKENPNPGANNPNLEFHLRSGSIHDNAIGSYTNHGVHMGGGVYAADYVDVKLHTGFEISDNAGFGQGGGIFLRGEHSTLSCTGTQVMGAAALITGNTAMRTSNWASENGRGGGIYVYQAASVQLSRVYFSGNNAGLGGSVCVERTPSVQISHCTFRDNDATSTVSDSNRAPGGAGIYVTNHFNTDLNTAVEITYCNFYGNYGKARGGAVYVDGENSRYSYSANDSRFRFYRIRLEGCVFGDGTAEGVNTAGVENDTNFNGMGGAVFHYAGELTVADCEFNRNSSTWRGGAIYAAYQNSYPQPSNITGNTVFTDNAAGNMGGAIYNDRARMNINGGENGTVSFTGNSAPVRGGAVCTNTNELRLDNCEFFRNSMIFTPVTGTDGVWLPMITQGLDVASNQAWVYMDPETVTANEFYFHHRSYCLRIDHPVPVYSAPEPTPENPEPEAPDPWSLKIELNVTEGSYYRGGDHVVEPDPAGAHLSNAEPYVSNFRLEGAAADAYNLVAYNKCLVLADKSVYIDGVNGDDLNDGMTPTTAVKTFPAARQKLVALLNGNPEAKKEIYVVNTVTVSDTQNWTFQGDTMPTGTQGEDPIQIYGVKMIAYVADNTWNTARKAMVLVDGGNLTFYGITLDGNRSAFSQKCATYGFHVKNNGRLKVENLGRVQNHYMGIYAEGNSAPENTPCVELDTAVVTNCQNHYSRTYSGGSDPYRETSAAGVTVKFGTLKIDEVEISGCIGFRKGGGMYLDTVSADISWLTVKTCRVQEPTNFYIQGTSGSYNGDYSYNFVNRTAAYSGVGGGAYFWNSDVTMSATDFTQCANPSYSGDNKNYPGLALAVRGGTLEADRCDFTENGQQTLSSDASPYYGYGVVHISGAAVVDLMRCRFTKNYSSYGGAIRLDMGRMVQEYQNNKYVYYAVDAPTLYLRGCEFGSSDEADANRTYYGGSAVWSQGHEHEHPKVYFYDYNEVADGELVATHTVVQNNKDYNFNGAVYALQTDLVAQNAVFRGNKILYMTGSFPSSWPTGGAAIHSHGGSLSLEGCTVTNNQTLSRYGTSWSAGAVFADRCDSIRVTGNTEFTGNEVVANYNSSNYSLYGSGMAIRSCADALIEDTVFSDNRHRVASFDYYNYNLNATGALHADSSTVTLRRVDCINNKHNVSKQQRVKFYGAAMHLYNCIAVLEDFYASNNVTPGNIDVTLSTARFTGFKAGVSVEKDIMLSGNTTPISLLSPLTGQGELKLRFDETFGGRHIVCGYTDDETEEGYPTWDANHDYTGYPHDVPAGTLNAWQYLEQGVSPRFAAAAAPTQRNLSLVRGDTFYRTQHDIIVKNEADVYLDGQTGVDPVWTETGALDHYSFDGNGIEHTGGSPAQAVKTFAAAKKLLEEVRQAEGGNIIVSGRVDVTAEEHWSLEPIERGMFPWTPRLLRYNQPSSISGARYTDYLVSVEPGGELFLDGLTVDGNWKICESPRVFNSLIRVNGGGLTMRGGTRLTNNNAEKGGAVFVTGSTSLVEMYDAVIDHCTVDWNAIGLVGQDKCYGGALYLEQGCEFRMQSADSLITACGVYYYTPHTGNAYGAAVYVDQSRFLMNNGKITDCQLFRGRSVRGSSYGLYGAIYTCGPRYNEETGEGTLVRVGGEISRNFLRMNDTDWIYQAEYVNEEINSHNYPSPVSGVVLYAEGGTVEFMPALVTEVPLGSGNFVQVSPGANVYGNRTRGGASFWIYARGNNTSYAGGNGFARIRMLGGVIDGERAIDTLLTTASYMMYLNQYSSFELVDGEFTSFPDAYQTVYMVNWPSLTIRGGVMRHNRTDGYGDHIIYISSGTVNMSGGVLTGNSGKNIVGIYNVSGSVNISGDAELYNLSNGVWSAQTLNTTGGAFHHCNYGAIVTGGTANIKGGEFYNCSSRGVIVQQTGTANVTKGLFRNNGAGLEVNHSSATLKISTNEVEIRNNSWGVRATGAKHFEIGNGVTIHDNSANTGYAPDSRGAGVYVRGDVRLCSIHGAEIYNNRARHNPSGNAENEGYGGGICIEPYYANNDIRSYEITGCDIHDNWASGGGGGVAVFNEIGGSAGQNYGAQLHLQSRIHNNSTDGSGGGVLINEKNDYQYTLEVYGNSDIQHNTAALDGGGICVWAGRNLLKSNNTTTTANPGRLAVGMQFYGSHVDYNTAGGSGGGVYILRSDRNNVRVLMDFSMEGKARIPCSINHNTAASGGGLAIDNRRRSNNNNYPVINDTDITVTLSDTPMSGNTATGSYGGGVFVKDSASLYLNNVTLLGNTSALGGGGLAATSKGLATTGGASKVYVSQGQIGKNVAENGQGNGVYMDKGDLRLNNNYTVIDEHDDIWLNDRAYPITMWSSFTNVGAVYNVYPAESYVAGDIVVRPGVPFGGYCDEASFALANFYSIRPGTVIDRLYPNLILGRIVFLDGEYGLDPVFNSDGTVDHYQTDELGVVHDGSTPEKAFRTFRASKAVLGEAPGAIYVSGTVHYRQDNEAEDDVWTLGEKQFLRRYCGFKVSSDRAYPGFTGDMFIVEQGTLTLENIPIEGSYKGTAGFVAEGSVFAVNGETAKLVFSEGASVKDNITTGDGAAVRIERGECRMDAGEISGNSTTGRGVIWQGDTFTLSGDTLKLEGVVYLAAGDEENHTPDRVISVVASPETETSPGVTALDFAPVNGHVFVNVQNPYDGRDIVAYPEGDIPLSAQIERYPLSPPIDSMFVVDNDPFAQNVLELRLPYQVYLDGVNGDDARDGSTPEQAVRTLQRTYELIAAAYADPDIVTSGGLVHVVDTVTVADEISLSAQYVCGAVTVDAHGPVAFKRYAQPTAHASIAGGGFEKPTNLNAVFNVAHGGELNLVNVTVDGHKYAVPEGSSPKLTADAVTAKAALVTVSSGGTFNMSGGRLQSAYAEASVPAGGSEPAKTGGALHIDDGGAAHISGGAIDGCAAYLSASELIGCEGVEGVSIYDNGSLSFSGSPAVSDAVYLESPEVRMSVPAAFTPAGKVFVIPATAFNGRDIVRYDDALSIPGAAQKASWDLPETVKQAYTLNNNAEDQRILELQLRACVYVDGVNGLDTNNGLTPESSVKSLQKAYTILSGLEGSTIYIVDNVTISSSTVLDGSVYESGATHIDAGSPVQIIRYAQPSGYDPEETDHGELNGFGVESYTDGPLLTVSGGVSVIISGVSVDGHGDPVTEGDVRYLSPGLVTSAALLKVEEDGMLRITGSAMLQNNNNTLTVPEGEDRGEGGAIENHGRLILDAAVLRGNQALHGAGIYQDGTVELNGTASPVIDPDQYIYLTGPKAATEAEKPEEHLITVTGMLADGFFVTVDLEYPEEGRDVSRFAAGAFVSDVEGEKNHFVLAPGIEYVIVKSNDPAEPDTLELGKGYSLTIFKYADMTDLKEPNKTFLFEITDVTPGAETNGNTYCVYIGTYTDAVTGETVPAWVDNAYSYVSVKGLPEGVYTVRELTDWSWRYEVTDAWGADDEHYAVSDDFTVTVTLDANRTVYFRNTLTDPDYVNGYARSYSNTFCP